MNEKPANGRPTVQWYVALGILCALGALIGVFGVAYLGHGDPKAGASLGAICTALLGALYAIIHPNGNGQGPGKP